MTTFRPCQSAHHDIDNVRTFNSAVNIAIRLKAIAIRLDFTDLYKSDAFGPIVTATASAKRLQPATVLDPRQVDLQSFI